MGGQVPFNKIVETGLNGVRNAFNAYYNWTNRIFWLNWAPESFIQIEIARSLAKICPLITLEDTLRSILIESGSELRGAKPRGSALGRVDIIVWWADRTPRILIEVKKAYNIYKLTKDAKRLRQLIYKENSLQKGIIFVYTDAKYSNTIKNRFIGLAEYSDTKLIKRLGPIKKGINGDYWHWDAGCFEVIK